MKVCPPASVDTNDVPSFDVTLCWVPPVFCQHTDWPTVMVAVVGENMFASLALTVAAEPLVLQLLLEDMSSLQARANNATPMRKTMGRIGTSWKKRLGSTFARTLLHPPSTSEPVRVSGQPNRDAHTD